MEIAARDRLVGTTARSRENQRIVGHGIGLNFERARGVNEEVERGAHHLRLATEAVGILDAVAIVVAGVDVAAVEQAAEPGGDRDLPGLAAKRVEALVERRDAALQGIDRHRARM